MTIQELIDKLKEHKDKTFGIRVNLVGDKVNCYFFTNIGYTRIGFNYFLYLKNTCFDHEYKDKYTAKEFIDYITDKGEYKHPLDADIRLAPKFDRYFDKGRYKICDGLTIEYDSVWLVVNILEHDPYNNDYFKELVENSQTQGETDE
jgi:hypothetical protein